jgi:hypothetical protein
MGWSLAWPTTKTLNLTGRSHEMLLLGNAAPRTRRLSSSCSACLVFVQDCGGLIRIGSMT